MPYLMNPGALPAGVRQSQVWATGKGAHFVGIDLGSGAELCHWPPLLLWHVKESLCVSIYYTHAKEILSLSRATAGARKGQCTWASDVLGAGEWT